MQRLDIAHDYGKRKGSSKEEYKKAVAGITSEERKELLLGQTF